MDLKNLTNENLITIDLDLNKKEDVIKYLVKRLYDEGKLSSEKDFYNAVLDREALSPTGFEAGLAVPHGKSNAVKEAAFAVAKLKRPISEWESVDENNKVELVFLLAIPTSEAGSTHIELLAELMTRISNEEYKKSLENSKDKHEFYKRLDMTIKEDDINVDKFEKTIVAVTACPAGIAHTYMAAEALVKAGKEMGVRVLVEKQGANGIENRHTNENLKNADAAIFAVDVAVKEVERFGHLPVYKTKVAAPLRDAKAIIEKALKQAEDHKKGTFNEIEEIEEKVSFGNEAKKAILTGISHIVPLIVAGGMIAAFATLIAQGFGLQDVFNAENSWLWMYRKLGSNLLGTLMVPVLSAYMAYSISDKPALGPGFAAGVAANMINGGFLAGMAGGFIAGYTIKMLKRYIPSKGTLAGFISFWVYPVLGTLIVGTLMFFVVGKPVTALNQGLISWLGSMAGTNAALFGAILGIMVSFDLGGPVNKAAYAFCIGAMAEGIIIPYAVFASVKMVSAFGVTFATLLFKKYFNEEEQEVGKSTWLLGLAGITEGAIPFMIADPLRVIPSLCIGSAITGSIVSVFNIGLDVPGAGIFSLFVLKGQPLLLGMGVWFGAAVFGAVISAALLVITRKSKLKKQ
ncbi:MULTISPECIES: PTS 2-O-a-mannosyl-D-glycerate transporter subunit IIABC [Clostridium]|uniref:PTS 2-O-a-mannosyl-D-glycerate transporter subunit IIABC n=1 Tax=Clostridium butyricum TaxID=1492 RepID=A0AAP9RHT8_CLOBU|nr:MULTISPECIES: PTS 2-O-a-mannosyl-D-glycerate transporter subunit IIABC [Clostridium]MDU4854164.1 PTS 2-O-a-mannosyl-D-glycerate transporter subunit IIABC [Clostridioides difficile]MBS4841447.1 PTS 2-O-a-mannosyl-D-glycerate transporter subunit IIABC [Clostridium sp.]MBZ5747171.1 PTS 2-O-a-mannosyl-D-glycerate transporter subunit IIABC [Clostridium butyricum]MDU1403167.1 PTS 2-O-a-mannosyl-D-glycerate transporter subunit IIABC [Clostridium sp.]MDU4751077.1 PTS 2-O-a-mannosyl-D-glycerate tran